MERYRSVGVATIAALIGTDTVRDFEMGPDFSQIGRRCERAVVTAYRDLRAHGTADFLALQACTTLYRVHHPEVFLSEARRQVAEWIDHHVVRGDAGRTPGCECG